MAPLAGAASSRVSAPCLSPLRPCRPQAPCRTPPGAGSLPRRAGCARAIRWVTSGADTASEGAQRFSASAFGGGGEDLFSADADIFSRNDPLADGTFFAMPPRPPSPASPAQAPQEASPGAGGASPQEGASELDAERSRTAALQRELVRAMQRLRCIALPCSSSGRACWRLWLQRS